MKNGTINWDIVVPVLKKELTQFCAGELSGRQLYAKAQSKNVGPEVRALIRPGVDRARSITKSALRRRSLV